jgi:aryl-alcohol dehydrogenase-like predicted oxidoreductase/predicted kinase
MRLSTEPDRDEAGAIATLQAALDAGVTTFDTARAYCIDDSEPGHNERLLARVVASPSTPTGLRRITKCGMRRPGGAWEPDGRARSLATDASESRVALGGAPLDLLLLHAPDPRVPLKTSARALARILGDGTARAVGLSNVGRTQLDEVAPLVPIAAVEVALGAYEDTAIRSGVAAWCFERGVELLAHAPLGGPERARRLARDPVLARIAAARTDGVQGPDVFLAYLLAVHPGIVPVVGARRPETVTRIAKVARIALAEGELAALDERFPVLGALRRPPVRRAGVPGEVVLVIGIPGAGKSRTAEAFASRGYDRLNRDVIGGSLRGIARLLDARLAGGARRVVLDNTYTSRASRNDVVRVAHAHGLGVRCVFLDTPLAEAQVNAVTRILARFGRLLSPEELTVLARKDTAALAPNALHRMARALEPPTLDEGFDAVEVVAFSRDDDPAYDARRTAAVFALDALGPRARELEPDPESIGAVRGVPPGTPCLVYAWRPGLDATAIQRVHAFAEVVGRAADRPVEAGVCPHPPGPPICWCRPPLPGLWLAFARRMGASARAGTLYGRTPADRAMARTLGLAFREV